MSNKDQVFNVIELAILGLTLAVTLLAVLVVYRQTTNHFTATRTSYYIERFNSDQLVEARLATDAWLETGQPARDLYEMVEQEAAARLNAADTATSLAGTETLPATHRLKEVRVLSNFFQELAVAMKHESLDEEYLWDVFGGLVLHYGSELEDFITETRRRKDRETLYQDFEELVPKMRELDGRFRKNA